MYGRHHLSAGDRDGGWVGLRAQPTHLLDDAKCEESISAGRVRNNETQFFTNDLHDHDEECREDDEETGAGDHFCESSMALVHSMFHENTLMAADGKN